MRNTNNKRHKSDVPVLPRNFTFRRHEIVFKLFPNLTGIQRVRITALLAKVKETACWRQTVSPNSWDKRSIFGFAVKETRRCIHLTILKARNYPRHMLQARLFQLFSDLIRWAFCRCERPGSKAQMHSPQRDVHVIDGSWIFCSVLVDFLSRIVSQCFCGVGMRHQRLLHAVEWYRIQVMELKPALTDYCFPKQKIKHINECH